MINLKKHIPECPKPRKEALDRARRLVDATTDDQVIVCASNAEAVSRVLYSAYVDITRKTGKNHFVTSEVDEAPAIMGLERLQELGCVHELAKANEQGMVTAEAIAHAITPRTALVSLSWACALTGVIHPIDEIAKVCKERDILLHIDASQVVGRGYFPWEEGELLTFENLLFVRGGMEMTPLVVGQDPHAAARAEVFASRALELEETCDHMVTEVARLRDLFEEQVRAEVPQARPLFTESHRLPHICAVAFPYVTSDALLYLLERKGLQASQGGDSFQQIGLLLEACHISPILSKTALSFGFSAATTEEEVEQAVTILKETVAHLQKTTQHLEMA